MEIFFLVFCTLYISDPASGAGPTLPVLAQILGVSDRNNRRDCITGLLIAHERRFMQVAEGARADVEALMTRLTSDQRHRNIRVLTFRQVPERRFPHWSMIQGPTTLALSAMLSNAERDLPSADHALTLLDEASSRLVAQAA